jgi:hypothetical protein
VPPVVADRTVEVTGPAEMRKMDINALNSGTKVFIVSKYVAGIRIGRDVAACYHFFHCISNSLPNFN